MRKFLLALIMPFVFCLMACARESVTSTPNGREVAINQIVDIQVPAVNIASPMAVKVILPESYFTNKDKRYPVAYLLNGHGGNEASWPCFIEPRLDSLASVYDMIMVCPDGRNSWYWDAPIDSTMKMETFFVEELVPYIDKKYRTVADAKHRAITGFSMGGHGGLWLAMRHSDVWGTGGSMSGGVDILDDARWAKYWDMYRRLGDRETNREVWESHTVINLVKDLHPNQLNIIVDCGVDDFFINANRKLHQELLKYNIPHDYTERPGRHVYPYWKNSIRYQLLYFHNVFTQ
ncbi:MAG: esterase family protein [Muribaculaceae bacterium]|nr:esterase family protein [Muribaculaceae bacterium]